MPDVKDILFQTVEKDGERFLIVPAEIIIAKDVLDELVRAEKIHPNYPSDPVHAAAIISEEAGEIVKAVNNIIDGKKTGRDSDYKTEAIHCAAMCIRFLKNIDNFDWNVEF